MAKDPDAGVRAAAFGALVRMGRAGPADLAIAIGDAAPWVRRHAAELSPHLGWAAGAYRALLDDGDAGVVEAACFAIGEVGDASAIDRLISIASEHGDPLCRESAIAALGALGLPAGLPAILAGLRDRPAIRRRAVIALAPFDGDEVDSALRAALEDRDWQVRQAAEDQLRKGG